ncbi:MAG TPA: hypothetical protein VLS93_01425 [Anaeromyxobacteraceae bacterium]|nr:hypothetical protein [Anaeromyxobacteraceae bacterium]
MNEAQEVWSLAAMAAFQRDVLTPAMYEGFGENCHYPVDVPQRPRLMLVLNVECLGDEVVVQSVDVEDPGGADEYQERCVAQWFTGVRARVPGLEPGGRWRIRYPVRL